MYFSAPVKHFERPCVWMVLLNVCHCVHVYEAQHRLGFFEYIKKFWCEIFKNVGYKHVWQCMNTEIDIIYMYIIEDK